METGCLPRQVLFVTKGRRCFLNYDICKLFNRPLRFSDDHVELAALSCYSQTRIQIPLKIAALSFISNRKLKLALSAFQIYFFRLLFWIRFGFNKWRDPMRPTQILAKLCKDEGLDGPHYSTGRVRIDNKVFGAASQVLEESGML